MLFDISKQLQEWKRSLIFPLTDDSTSPGLLNKDFSTHSYTSPHKIPEAQKRYPFWATPPSIGLSREYPPPPHLHPSPFYKMNILVLPFTWNLFGRSFALVVQIIYFFGFYKIESCYINSTLATVKGGLKDSKLNLN